METGTPKIAVVIPCYNEADRLDLASFGRFADAEPDFDLWFVNDGSSDRTAEVLQGFAESRPNRVFFHHLPQNQGKAEAVRQGILAARANPVYTHLAFLDADLATPLPELPYLLAYGRFRNWSGGMLFGSRVKILGSHIERNPLRHYFGRISATGASVCLQLPVYDTQCGIKVFSADVSEIAFARPFLSRWLFDVEIFFRLKNAWSAAEFDQKVLEVPIRSWTEIPGTKIRFSDILKVPMELFRIYRHYQPPSVP